MVVEDLATKNLMANRSLAAAIGDQGWAELARQLGYKTARHGGRLIVADRWFASSKTCSACGAVRPKLTLAERTYRCGDDSCGHVADRDVNAAANLAAWGEHTLGLCPCVIQAGDRHPGGPTAEKTSACLWRVGVRSGRLGCSGAARRSRNQPAPPRRGVSTGRPGQGCSRRWTCSGISLDSRGGDVTLSDGCGPPHPDRAARPSL